MIIEITRLTMNVNVKLQLDFSSKVKCRTKRNIQIAKRTDTGRKIYNKYFHLLNRKVQSDKYIGSQANVEAKSTIKNLYNLLQMHI